MKRREFITSVGGGAVAAVLGPFAARAQRTGRPFQIGYVVSHRKDGLPKRLEVFRAELRALGWQEGRDFAIEFRWADGDYERLPGIFAELVRLKVDVIVTHGTPAMLAAKAATTTIPIVVAVIGDALATGAITNLARPEGNVTGSTFFNPELSAKRLELLKEAHPRPDRCGRPAESGQRHEHPGDAADAPDRAAAQAGAS